MEQLNFITNILEIKDKNIIILDYLDAGTHKEVIAKLDYPASKCHNCQGQMAKYDFQRIQNPLPRMRLLQDSHSIEKTPFPL